MNKVWHGYDLVRNDDCIELFAGSERRSVVVIGKLHHQPVKLMMAEALGVPYVSFYRTTRLCGNKNCINPDHHDPASMRKSVSDITEKFWSANTKPGTNGCLEWIGGKFQSGYGAIKINGKTLKASRVAYIRKHGVIPRGLCALHRCDNRPCVNPDHLFLGTLGDNNQDRDRKGRTARQCGENHGMAKLSQEDVRQIRSMRKTGVRVKDIAKIYKINAAHCGAICNNRKWANS